MNTIKDLAKNWWKDLSNREKAKLTFYFDPGRRWEWLFEAEIESIFYQEVIVKWWNGQIKMHDGTEYRKTLDHIVNENDIKEMYLERDEQPLKGDVLEEELWNTPQSVDNTIDMEEVNYQNSNLVTEKKEAIDFADWLLTYYEMDNFPLLHPKRNGDEDLCWKLGGTEQRYTTVEIYQIWLNEPKAIEDNVWDEARKKYLKISTGTILLNSENTLFEFFKHHLLTN